MNDADGDRVGLLRVARYPKCSGELLPVCLRAHFPFGWIYAHSRRKEGWYSEVIVSLERIGFRKFALTHV